VILPNANAPLSVPDITPMEFKRNSELLFGPFENIDRYSTKDLSVHFQNDNKAMIATEYEKTIKVAYWRPLLHIQEDFEIHNKGPKLKGHFSQIDFKMRNEKNGMSNSITKFQAILPENANDVYYKDLVGNVTTSNFRLEKRRSVLELRPRYPVYGGWKYTWFHGYTIPQLGFLSSLGNDEHELSVSLLPSIKGLVCEKAKLKVILPEGAR
jgi:oligosaccharyltransferase complex subunit alpha (ribophorin I)